MLRVLVTNEEKGEPKWKFRLDLLSLWIIFQGLPYRAFHLLALWCTTQRSEVGWRQKRKKKKKYFEFPLSHQICSHWWAPHLPTLLPGCCNSTALWLNFTKFHYLCLTFTKLHCLCLTFTKLHCLCLTFTKFHCLCLTFLKSRPTSLTIALVAVNLLGLTQGMSVIRWL